VGTPPNCITPRISNRTVKPGRARITLSFEVNAPGHVTVSGKGVKSRTVSTDGGRVKIALRLSSKAKRTLRERQKLRLKLKIDYSPDGAGDLIQQLTVRLTAKRNHRHPS
jgi:hypothetical protein